MSESIWQTLSAINCNEHVKTKGGYSYLAWTWAWAMVKERYPHAIYRIKPDTIYPDGTMEVRVEVSIPDSTIPYDDCPTCGAPVTLSHTMWLPVLDFKNKAIANPNAFDINSARMRCLVKCLAMFGLGHYIYAGESEPAEPPRETFTPEMKSEFLSLVAAGDGFALKAFGQNVGSEVMSDLFNDSPQGQKTKLKAAVREAVNEANDRLRSYLVAIEDALVTGSKSSLDEIYEELDATEAHFVNAGLTEVQQQQIRELGE